MTLKPILRLTGQCVCTGAQLMIVSIWRWPRGLSASYGLRISVCITRRLSPGSLDGLRSAQETTYAL